MSIQMPSKPIRLVNSKTDGSVRCNCVIKTGSSRRSLALIRLGRMGMSSMVVGGGWHVPEPRAKGVAGGARSRVPAAACLPLPGIAGADKPPLAPKRSMATQEHDYRTAPRGPQRPADTSPKVQSRTPDKMPHSTALGVCVQWRERKSNLHQAREPRVNHADRTNRRAGVDCRLRLPDRREPAVAPDRAAALLVRHPPRAACSATTPPPASTKCATRARCVGGFTIQADGALLLLMADGAVKTWRDGRVDDRDRGDPRRARHPLQRLHRRSGGPRLRRTCSPRPSGPAASTGSTRTAR